MNRSMQPTGWIRASENSPSTTTTSRRASATRRTPSGSRLALKENAVTVSDSPVRASPVRRLALQERSSNYDSPALTPAKRSLPSRPDATSQQKRPRPGLGASGSGSGQAQTTLNAFFIKKPTPGCSTSKSSLARSDSALQRNENPLSGQSTTPTASRRRSALEEVTPGHNDGVGNADDEEAVFRRAQRILNSGRFGSLPRSVRPSSSDLDPLNRPPTSPERSGSPLSRKALQHAKANGSPSIGPDADLGPPYSVPTRATKHNAPARSGREAVPRARTTDPPPAIGTVNMEETPFMHETLSNFQPFAWQTKAKPLMPRFQRSAGLRETQIKERERKAMSEQVAAAHRRMATSDSIRIQERTASKSRDTAKEPEQQCAGEATQVLESDEEPYDEARRNADGDLSQVAGPSKASTTPSQNNEARPVANSHLPHSCADESSCVVLPVDEHDTMAPPPGEGKKDPVREADLRPNSQGKQRLGLPEVVMRSPRTNRRVYALETQVQDGTGRTGLKPLRSLPRFSRDALATSSESPMASRTRTASSRQGSQHGTTPTRARSRSSQPRRSLKPQSEMLAAFEGSSPMTSLPPDVPRDGTPSATSTAPSRQDRTAESGRDGGISGSADSTGSPSSEGDSRRGPQDETYGDHDEAMLRRHFVSTPTRRPPLRAPVTSAGRGSAKRASQYSMREEHGRHSQLVAATAIAAESPEVDDSQATQPLVWHTAETQQAGFAPGTDDDETQPLAWEVNSQESGSSSGHGDLVLARSLNEHAVRTRASQVRSALDRGSQQASHASLRETARQNAGQTATADTSDDEQKALFARSAMSQLGRVRSFRSRHDAQAHPYPSAVEPIPVSSASLLPSAEPHRSPEPAFAAASPGTSSRCNHVNTPLRPADVSPVTLSSPSPGGPNRFDAILSALHRTRKEEAEQEARESKASVADARGQEGRGGRDQCSLTAFGFSHSPKRRRAESSNGSCFTAVGEARQERRARGSIDWQDDKLSDDEDEWEHGGDRSSAMDCDSPAAHEGSNAAVRPRPSTPSEADSETLPLSLERRLLAERHGRSSSPEENDGDDGDRTVLYDEARRRAVRSTPSGRDEEGKRDEEARSSSSRSSSQSSKEWMPGESLVDADEVVRRFVRGS